MGVTLVFPLEGNRPAARAALATAGMIHADLRNCVSHTANVYSVNASEKMSLRTSWRGDMLPDHESFDLAVFSSSCSSTDPVPFSTAALVPSEGSPQGAIPKHDEHQSSKRHQAA